MRHLNYMWLLVVVGSMSAFACGDDDAPSAHSDSAGDAGEAGESDVGTAGHVATAGKAGSGGKSGGSAGKGGGSGGNGGGSAGKGGSGGGGGGGTAGSGASGGTVGGTSGAAGSGEEAGAGGEPEVLSSFKVNVSGVPSGATAAISVTGPGSFSQNISATTTLQGLSAGSYAVSAPAVIAHGTQVDSAFDAAVTGSPAAVAPDPLATASVSYAKRPGTGMLWVTNWTTRNLFGFDQTQVAKTGTQTDGPTVTLSLPGTGTGSATIPVTFSANGDAWVGTCKNGQKPQILERFSGAKLGMSGSPSADVTITLPGTDATYDCVTALTFDVGGNLWVGTYSGGHIMKINAADLTETGTPTPAVILTNATLFPGVVDLLFDSSGNLFVGPYYKPVVSRLSAAQLAASDAAIVPAVQLSLDATAAVGGLTLDKAGALWVTDYNAGTVLSFPASAQSTTATPTPAVTLTVGGGPEQVAFDNAGNLWVAAYNASKVFAFAAADVTATGSPAPLTTLTSSAFDSNYAVRFNLGTH